MYSDDKIKGVTSWARYWSTGEHSVALQCSNTHPNVIGERYKLLTLDHPIKFADSKSNGSVPYLSTPESTGNGWLLRKD